MKMSSNKGPEEAKQIFLLNEFRGKTEERRLHGKKNHAGNQFIKDEEYRLT